MNTFYHVDNTIALRTLRAARGRVHLGLCCINMTLRDQDIFCSRTCRQCKYTPEYAITLATKNVSCIEPLLRYNHEHKIGSLRLSSDMFPHFTNPDVESYKPTKEIETILRNAGQLSRELGQRLTMHPGQYNVVGTPRRDVFEKTVADLEHHAWILDTMGAGEEGVLCIHMGGSYGDMETTLRRWVDQFDELPRSVKRRLAIENTEDHGSVSECLHIAHECNIPLIYDSHHYYCYCYNHPDQVVPDIEDQMDEIIETWKGVQPLFHISDQSMVLNKYGKLDIGKHADYVKEIPAHMLKCCEHYDTDITIEVEAKKKDWAIAKLQERYTQLF